MPQIDKKQTRGFLMKSAPAGLFKAEHELKGYLTVEVRDRDGDIIRVGGIQQPEEPLRVMGFGRTHNYEPVDGEMPYVATVKELVPTVRTVNGKAVPAMAFGAEWEKSDAGEMTPFAAKTKSLYDKGKLSAFSGGFDVLEHGEYPGGRYDVTESRPFEVSCCLIPANPYTTVIKALQSEFGSDYDAAVMEERLIHLSEQMEALAGLPTLLKAYELRLDEIAAHFALGSQAAQAPESHPNAQRQIDPVALATAIAEAMKRN
jgi:hypothetical protein